MAEFAVIYTEFTGRNGAGAISVPELKAGDIVVWTRVLVTWQSPGAVFENIITVDGEIQQTPDNLSTVTCGVLVIRGVN